MGGKKKTKWRKLPLEEFTKDIPSKPEKFPSADACQTDLTREENDYTPSCSETSETVQNYAEPYEYIDGLYYPTSCVVYNPGVYSNYMMPVDTCYYYYTMPEAAQVQEYMPMPYQEYTSALPKDTVYLLLPTQTFRPIQPVQNSAPEWQNRRRRRRYEGYADYAVIPEKSSSTKTEERDHGKPPSQHVNSRRNSAQPNGYRRMTSFTETSKFDDTVSEQSQSCSKPNDVKKNSTTFTNKNSGRSPNSSNKGTEKLSNEINQTYAKNREICDIHSRNNIANKEQQIAGKKTNPNSLQEEMNNEGNIIFSSELGSDNFMPPYSSNISDKSSDITTNKTKEIEQSNAGDNVDLSTKEFSGHTVDLHDINQKTHRNTKATENFMQPKHDVLQQIPVDDLMHNLPAEDILKTDSQSSLPDILSTLNKPTNEKIRDPDNCSESHISDNVDLDKGRSLKSKPLFTQTSYFPNLLSSEALHNEMEMELKQLQSLHSLQANQSIYKLAYDENVTDQSEVDSRSPSPVDPESQVPSSLTSAEILIHEADSGSDAGSEDVELLPHRYESETFLNENKHVYVNKLSLAVELLRTQESLPYDDEFKRVVGENVPGVHTGGKVNMGFMEDSCPPHTFSITNSSEKCASTSTNGNEITSQCQLKHSADSSNDSAIFSDIDFGSFEDELCEPAKEAVAPSNEIQDNTEEIRAGYRRFGVQARHYFSPRAALSLNPCFCCIIM